jgi:Protein of unknown function (DUF2691).
MNRGIRFEIPNQHGKFIAEVLQPIDCLHYEWHIDRDEIWKSHGVGVPLFTKQCMDGHEFLNLINSNYYVVFIVLKAFSQKMRSAKISTYEDFVRSECALLLLISDSRFVDIYCKDQIQLEKLYENAKHKYYRNLGYINENDSRTRMNVD